MDASGRILLPAPLREFANLDKRVVLVGQGNKFEIWNEPSWLGLARALLAGMGKMMANPCPIWIRWRSEQE
jgi:MraZ protein